MTGPLKPSNVIIELTSNGDHVPPQRKTKTQLPVTLELRHPQYKHLHTILRKTQCGFTAHTKLKKSLGWDLTDAEMEKIVVSTKIQEARARS